MGALGRPLSFTLESRNTRDHTIIVIFRFKMLVVTHYASSQSSKHDIDIERLVG